MRLQLDLTADDIRVIIRALDLCYGDNALDVKCKLLQAQVDTMQATIKDYVEDAERRLLA